MNLWILLVAGAVAVVATLLAFELLAPARAAALALRFERRRAGVRSATLPVSDYTVSYWRGGHGETVLLLHGFGADKDNFVRVAAYLTPHFDVVAPDLSGFGDSDRLDDADFSFTAQAERVHDFVQALGLPALHIGGSSMGGAIATVFAERYPQQVKSVWLLAPAGVDGASDSEMAAEYRRSGRSMLVARVASEFKSIMQLTMSKQPFLPACVRRTLAARAAADAPLHERIFETIATGPGINAAASRVAAPTRIVWGSEDRVLDVSGADLLRTQMPNATLWRIDRTGHLPMVERPKPVARDFIAFCEAQGRTTTGRP